MLSDVRVSIALCTYNGAAFLDEQLRSISAQTLTPAELIACDDGSADSTVEVLAEFARTAPFPVTIRRNDERLGASRNFDQAIRLCTGDLIALADQDDVWHRAKLERLSAALADHQTAQYAFSDATLIDERGAEVGGKSLLARRFSLESIRAAFQHGNELDLMLKRDFIYGTTLMLRASACDVVPPVPPTWSHDTWFVNVLTLLGRGGVPVLERLVRYRQHGIQASGGMGAPHIVDDATRVRAYEDLRDELAALSTRGVDVRPDALARIDDKLRYLRAVRDSAASSAVRRAAIASREVLSGRWWRYSPRTFLVDKRPGVNALRGRR